MKDSDDENISELQKKVEEIDKGLGDHIKTHGELRPMSEMDEAVEEARTALQ